VNLKRNLLANYLGQGWSAFIGIIFVPSYIKILGMESYGLIGFFSILVAWMTLLDMGLTPTLNREIARYKAGAISDQKILDLIRSIEWICLLAGIVILLAVFTLAPIISLRWLKITQLPHDEVVWAIRVMGLVIAARIFEELYRAAIRGMQYQVWLNATQSILATIRWVGALIVLIMVSPTIQAFFIWQAIVSLISVAIYRHKTYTWLPIIPYKGVFKMQSIIEIRRFAGGMAAITLLSLILTQVDKFLLSGMLSLDNFGYYTLAGVVAGGLTQLISPINAAIFPKFTELVTSGDQPSLASNFHNASQLMAFIIVPPAFVLTIFSSEILELWTANLILAENAAPILTLLTLGVLLNGFMNIPYMLLLSHGLTGFSVRINLFSAVFIVPLILILVPVYGVIAAGWIWILLNAINLFGSTNLMYRYVLKKERWKWYRYSVFQPLIFGSLAAVFCRWMFTNWTSNFYAVINIFATLLILVVTLALVTPLVRQKLFKKLNLLGS
jgi:O-antigen/teichoic acid export membrane protein